MKTFILVCTMFYGTEAPQWTEQETYNLAGCSLPFVGLEHCQQAEAWAKLVKREGVTILTSCSPQADSSPKED